MRPVRLPFSPSPFLPSPLFLFLFFYTRHSHSCASTGYAAGAPIGGALLGATGNNWQVVAAYSGAAAIIVESSALSTVTGIAYLVTFARNGQLEIFFLSIYVMMTVRPALSRPVSFRSRADGLSRGNSASRRS